MADIARLDKSRRVAVGTLEKDSKLREIYESTRFKDPKGVPEKLQGELHEYLVRLLQVYSENPRNGCHGKWLEAYNDFIDDVYVGECDDETNCAFYGLVGSDKDSYLRMVAESTREASKTCYNVMQAQMRGLMETEFEHSNSGPTTLAKRLLKTQVSRQLEREKWAREMVTILQLASGLDQETPVNLGEVVNALDKIKTGDEETIQRFTSALSEYAVNNVDLKDSTDDPNGRGRFGKAMGKLCRPYTDLKKFLAETGGINTDDDESERKPFEFYTLIYSLVRVTNHDAIFGVTKDQFEDDVIKNRWEALYLATFACQIISTTWGELDYETNKAKFNVLLRPTASIMIADWPIEVLQDKLPVLYPKAGGAPSSSSRKSSNKDKSGSKSAMFGKKFKLNFRSSKDKEAEQHQHQHQQPTPAPLPAAPLPGLASILDNPAGPPPMSAHESQHIVQRKAEHETSKPAPSSSASSLMEPAKESARDAPIMSLDTILMFKKLHGRYPKLPEYYKKIYPELPDDLSGEYPKELGQPTTARPQPKPVAPMPAYVAPKPAYAAPVHKSNKPDFSSLAGLKF
jgi:hypothetical protein